MIMGFRSTFTTEDYAIKWPQWFIDKYAGTIAFVDGGVGPLHSVREMKTYRRMAELPHDIQIAIDWGSFSSAFVMVYLHECGGITRCQIEKDAIKWSEPSQWKRTDGIDHWHCYGCSDV